MSAVAIATSRRPKDDRIELRRAIAAAVEARQTVSRREVAIEKARELLKESELKVKAATAAVATARDEDARSLAEVLTTGGGSSARAARAARIAESDALDEVEAAKAARKRLEDDLADAQIDLGQAERALDAAIAATLEPIARAMFDRALRRRAEYQRTLFALGMLQRPLGLMSDLSKQIERLTFIGRFDEEDRELSLAVRAKFEPVLAAVRTDPDVQLPDE